jgi:putative ABC transport system permease protein
VNPLVRFALWLCPAEYAREYGAEIAHDIAARRFSIASIAANVAFHGIALRVENFVRDVRVATRSLSRTPLYTLVAGLTIALAIGANVAVTSVLSTVVLNPLPYPQADRIVTFGPSAEAVPGISTMPYRDAQTIVALTSTLERISVGQGDEQTLIGFGRPVSLRGSIVSADFFTLFGVHPLLGRVLDTSDTGSARVVISERAWRQYFAASPNILGTRIQLGDTRQTIVGVIPRDFEDPAPIAPAVRDYWEPLNPRSPTALAPARYAFFGRARLRQGVTLAAARADINRVMQEIIHRDPSVHAGVQGATLEPVSRTLLGDTPALLWFLYAAVSIVVLIACANIANLSLVRASMRNTDFIVRWALGASRRRLLIALTTEAAVLAAFGGVIGLALACLGLQLLGPVTASLPRSAHITIAAPMLAYTFAIVAFAALLTGLLPGAFLRRNSGDALKTAGRGKDRSATKRIRFALVVLEVALAITVTTSAGLVLRSFIALVHTDAGIQAQNVAQFPLSTLPRRYDAASARIELVHRITGALTAIPGIQSASVATQIPFVTQSITTVGIPARAGRSAISTTSADGGIDADYFKILGIALRSGRPFTPADRMSAPLVAIVNENFARRYFGTMDVIGRRIFAGYTPDGKDLTRTIVGTVADTRPSFSQPAVPQFYLPESQAEYMNPRAAHFVIRTTGPVSGLSAAIVEAVRRIDPELAPGNLQSMTAAMANSALRSQAATTLFALLAGIALMLAIAGIYAVTASSVEGRTQEFGIRKAVGARSTHVLADVIGNAIAQSSAGIALGLLATAFISPFLATLLFATSALDPATFAAVVVLLLLCTVIAAVVPALRAMRLAPAKALRYE